MISYAYTRYNNFQMDFATFIKKTKCVGERTSIFSTAIKPLYEFNSFVLLISVIM